MGGIGSGPKEKYSPEIAQKFMELRTQGFRLRQVCEKLGIHPTTYANWIEKYPDFQSAAARASAVASELLAEEVLDIHQSCEDVNRGRLQSENIKWFLKCTAPSKYGDRVGIDITSTVNVGGALEEALRRALPNRDASDKPQPIDIVIESESSASPELGDAPNNQPDSPLNSDIFD